MKPFRLGVISDIHLGHPNTLTEFIIANLNRYFSCDKYFASVDMVVLAGDVYDKILMLGSMEAQLIDRWIGRVRRLAKKHNVLVRVLEGTPLHDRTQPKRFAIHHELALKDNDDKVDLKYVDKVSIEYIERFDIRVLYIPDEANGTTDVTLAQVKELMAQEGIQKVDMGFFHGAFAYQLPDLVNPLKTHDLEAYSELVEKLIYIGHVHERSLNGKAVAQGSFDRLGHGTEGMKGFVHSDFEADGTHRTRFVDNPTAMVYKTIFYDGQDIEQGLNHIGHQLKDVPDGSHVRLETDRGNPLLADVPALMLRWPTMHWKTKEKKKAKDATLNQLLLEDSPQETALVVNPGNISKLLMERLAKKNVDPTILAQCYPHLKELEEL